jgi:DNA polymerase III subunit alpha
MSLNQSEAKKYFFNLNVNINSNLSFSLIKIDEFVDFCKINGLNYASICDYYQYDFIKFYYLCRECKIKPIFGIKKKLLINDKIFLLNIYPVNYKRYKEINHFFYVNGIDKIINFKLITKGFFNELLIVLEISNEFEFEQLNNLRKVLIKKFNLNDEIYLGLNFFPKKENINTFSQYYILPFHSVKVLSEKDKYYLEKFKFINDRNLKKFEDVNRKYFHYFNYYDFLIIFEGNNVSDILIDNLRKFTSRIRFIVKKSHFDKELDFLNLKTLCFEKLKSLNVNSKENYEKTLLEELNIIKEKNYSSYFNTLSQLPDLFLENGIELGPGRGSAVSSLVSYLIGITQIDPIKNKLYFWRFLNIKRFSPPDVDIDVSDQEKAFSKIIEKFGKKYVSRISIRRKIGSNLLIKESISVFNFSKENEEFILENIDYFSRFVNGEESLLDSELKFKFIVDDNDNFFDFIKRMSGMYISSSVHASALVILKNEVSKLVPMEKEDKDNNLPNCQLSNESLGYLGLKKFDFLSLIESLNFIREIKKSVPSIPNYKELTFNDNKTWNLLKSGLISCIFQLDSNISRNIIYNFKPEKFKDLLIIISLNRPGAISNLNLILENRKKNCNVFHEGFLNEIVSDTYGCIIFEEQISIIISFCLSLDIYESENIRRKLKSIVNIKEEIDKFKEYFQEKSSIKICKEDQISVLNKILKSIPYMFNKAHAVSYAYLTYLMLYIKANFFGHSISYLLDKNISNHEKFFSILSEATLKGYEILKPEINNSNYNSFAINNRIFIGFICFSGCEKGFFQEIINDREKYGKFKSLKDFFDRNITLMKNLPKNFPYWIKSGLVRSLDYKSFQIVHNFDFFLRYIKLKNRLLIDNEYVPFLDKKIKCSTLNKSVDNLNEIDVNSFNCYISYFNHWKKNVNVSNDNIKSLISTFLNWKTKEGNKKIIETYSILNKFEKKKNNYLFTIFDINEVLKVFVNFDFFEKYREVIALNKEFIFKFSLTKDGNFKLLIKLESMKEVML